MSEIKYERKEKCMKFKKISEIRYKGERQIHESEKK
jgi:hypothetical protein